MIKENRIVFGYGTVVVGSSNTSAAISFASSATAHPVGERAAPNSERQDFVSIQLDMKRYEELLEQLSHVEKREAETFSFCGYTFDFSNYNPESIHVIRKKAFDAMSPQLIAQAC